MMDLAGLQSLSVAEQVVPGLRHGLILKYLIPSHSEFGLLQIQIQVLGFA
jgi:hypothetical protein